MKNIIKTLGLVGLLSITSCSKRDFVRIQDVKYCRICSHLTIDVEGFDKEGKVFSYYLNGKLIGKSGYNPHRIEGKFYIGIPIYGKIRESLKNREHHTLKVILEDDEENKVEDSYKFNYKFNNN